MRYIWSIWFSYFANCDKPQNYIMVMSFHCLTLWAKTKSVHEKFRGAKLKNWSDFLWVFLFCLNFIVELNVSILQCIVLLSGFFGPIFVLRLNCLIIMCQVVKPCKWTKLYMLYPIWVELSTYFHVKFYKLR